MTQQAQINAAPPTLDHVIGQKRAVKQLKTALEAYFNDRSLSPTTQSMPHILLTGPAGVGKSLLAGVISREIASNCHEELTQNILTPPQLQGLMMLLDPEDVLFVDEIHELQPQVQTTLLRAMEERKIFLPALGNRKAHALSLPPFTMVGASTDEWALSKPLRDRFKIVLRLTHYSYNEISQLLKQRASRLGWQLDNDVFLQIARRSRGTPRLAIRLLESCQRTSRAANADVITSKHFEDTCHIEGIDSLGLDQLEQQYLAILNEARDAVRLNILTMRIGLPRKTIDSVIEPELIRLGLITKNDKGRLLTEKGHQHLQTANPQEVIHEQEANTES